MWDRSSVRSRSLLPAGLHGRSAAHPCHCACHLLVAEALFDSQTVRRTAGFYRRLRAVTSCPQISATNFPRQAFPSLTCIVGPGRTHHFGRFKFQSLFLPLYTRYLGLHKMTLSQILYCFNNQQKRTWADYSHYIAGPKIHTFHGSLPPFSPSLPSPLLPFLSPPPSASPPIRIRSLKYS